MILYADAGGASHGDIWIGVADHTGTLIDSDLMHDTLLNLAEMGAVLLACDYAQIGEPGVILTDSLVAAKSLGGGWGLHKMTTRVDEHIAMRDAIRRKLPDGWCVAWIPRDSNLADAALEAHIRSTCRFEVEAKVIRPVGYHSTQSRPERLSAAQAETQAPVPEWRARSPRALT